MSILSVSISYSGGRLSTVQEQQNDIEIQSHLAVPELIEPDSPLSRRNSLDALTSYITAPAEPENKDIRIRMISPGELLLLSHNLVLLNQILMVDLEALFLKRNKRGEVKG